MDVGEVDAVFEVGPVPADLAALALAAGAPPGLLERMWALRYPRPRIEFAFRGAPFPTMAMWEAELDQRERLSDGLVVREATWDDDARLSDLFADSAERLGAWDVTVERSPNPYAQARLQENAHTKLVVDRGVALAVSTQAGRNSLVGGERLSVAWMGGWRVRNGFRRHGFSTMLMNTPGPAASRFGALTYWYVRLENGTANSWIASAVRPIDESGRAFEKRTATVYHLDPAAGRRDPRVRLIRPDDVDRCVELINTTHAGLDLFRPYSPSWFEERLYDLLWGPRPPFVANVYGWDDMAVLVDGGRIVACAGLWDKGRDVRGGATANQVKSASSTRRASWTSGASPGTRPSWPPLCATTWPRPAISAEPRSPPRSSSCPRYWTTWPTPPPDPRPARSRPWASPATNSASTPP